MCSSAYWPDFLSVGEMLQTSRDTAEVYEWFELRNLPALNVCRSNKPWRIAALSGIALSGELHLFQDMVSYDLYCSSKQSLLKTVIYEQLLNAAALRGHYLLVHCLVPSQKTTVKQYVYVQMVSI